MTCKHEPLESCPGVPTKFIELGHGEDVVAYSIPHSKLGAVYNVPVLVCRLCRCLYVPDEESR